MILFVLFLVAVGFALAVSVQRSQVISNAHMDLESRAVLSRVADTINIAYIEGDGFSMDVSLPERILRLDYTVEIHSNEVILRTDGRTYIRQILTSNVTGTPSRGINRVMNQEGEIRITEVA